MGDKRVASTDEDASTSRHRLHVVWRVVKVVVVVAIVWNAVSFGRYVFTDNGDTTSEKMATWGRNHHLGSVIDWMEARAYSDPPARAPAKSLSLSTPTLVPPVATAPAPTNTSTTDVVTAATLTTPTTPSAHEIPASTEPTPSVPSATTTVAPANPAVDSEQPLLPPPPLTPLFTTPLAGEGAWAPIARANGADAIWATSIRPLPAYGGVVASIAEFDQTHLRSGLFNGSEVPGGTWQRGNRVPDALQPSLLVAFNGGFRFEHMKGGYVTEGVVVKPLRNGDATLAVGNDGRLVLGQWGRDMVDDGSWKSIRQNLILIVDGGKSQVQKGINQGVWWGADYGKQVYVPRSAVCAMPDGRLAYVIVGDVDAFQLADSLINIGCSKAIQLDINGTWPAFFTFGPDKHGSLVGHPLDRRMGGNPYRYLSGSTKEFFALFDDPLVPASSVLDD